MKISSLLTHLLCCHKLCRPSGTGRWLGVEVNHAFVVCVELETVCGIRQPEDLNEKTHSPRNLNFPIAI